MKEKGRGVFAILLCAAILFSFSACRTNDNTIESTSDIETATGTHGTSSAETEVSEVNSAESSTTADSKTVSKSLPSTKVSEEVNLFKGLNSTSTEKVVQYYKAAAKNTDSIDAMQYMSIKRIDYTPKSSTQKGIFAVFTGIAVAALKANSKPVTEVPGNHQALKSSDLESANAIVDGQYTIITLNVKTQEEDQNAKDGRSGHVGHAVGTVGNISVVLKEIPSIKVDYSQGRILFKYDDCKVVVKVDNTTGRIVSGSWGYTVNISIDNIYASIAGSDNLLITDTGGAVDYIVKTNELTTSVSANKIY